MLRHHDRDWRRRSSASPSWLALVFCLILGGCAGTGYHPPPHTAFDLDVKEWLAGANDPIGILIVQQLTNDRRTPPLVKEALKNLGIPYHFGGASPATGFDCSGLITYSAAKALNLTLPHNAFDMAQRGTVVDRQALKAGDLVFFNTLGQPYSHVGIYLGEQRFVHSPSTGGVVRVDNLSTAYWSNRYDGARRLYNSLIAASPPAN